MSGSSTFIELVKCVGTFAFFTVIAIVLLMVLISIVDRYPGRKSKVGNDEEAGPGKP